jgi:hypothetical protein
MARQVSDGQGDRETLQQNGPGAAQARVQGPRRVPHLLLIGRYEWPSFNIADSSIVAAAVVFLRIRDESLAAACRDFPRQALHARRLALKHPVTGTPMDFIAPVPPDMASLLDAAGLRLPGVR